MLAVGVGENPRESLSELAKLGARLIIQRAVEDEFDAWLGRARYERRPDDQREACERGERAAQRVSPAEGADRGGGARDRDPAGPPGGGDVRVQAVPADAEAVADRAVEGVGDRRVRARPVDARCRVAVRGGGAGEAVEVDGLEDVRGAQGALRAVQAPRPLRDPAGRAVPRRDVHRGQTGRAEGGRAGRLGVHRGRRARAAGGDASGCASPSRTGRPSAAI